MTKQILENVLENLINQNTEEASSLFKQYMIEKSREINTSLIKESHTVDEVESEDEAETED